MRVPVFCLLGLLLAGANSATLAQTKFDPQVRATAIAPFVDEQTIGVAHVDLSRVDFDRLLKQAAELAPGADKTLAPAIEHFRPMAKHLVESGVKDVYLVLSLADLPGPPFFVFPLAADADTTSLEHWHGELHVETIERVGNALFAGGKQTLERIKSRAPAARPEIARAFEAAGDTAAQVLFLPSADNRRVVEELLPMLPAEAGGGPSKVLTRGAMWAAAGIELTPQAKLKFVIQSQDREAAAALHDKWLAALQLLGRDARVEKTIPKFKQLADQLAPTVKADRLQLTLNQQSPSWGPLAEVLQKGLGEMQESGRRKETINHLKQVGIAMHNYADVYKSFPPAASYSADGKPLLSWRVHLLPYLEQQQLYQEFHLDEPWDSEHNRKLVERMPDVYRSTNWSPEQPTKTCFVIVTSEGSAADSRKRAPPAAATKDKPQAATAFQGREGVGFQDITDGTSNTILVVEADPEHAVIWSKPDDLSFDPKQPSKGFGVNARGFVPAAFCDGSVRLLKGSLDAETWRRYLLRNDGETIGNE